MVAKWIKGQGDTAVARLTEAMSREMPPRALLMMGGGPFTRKRLDALLLLINGKLVRGAGALLRSILTKR